MMLLRKPRLGMFGRVASTAVLTCVAAVLIGMFAAEPAYAQTDFFKFEQRPAKAALVDGKARRRRRKGDKQMMVQASEVQYDHVNHRVNAVGNVQIYYDGSTIEADKVTYNQNTKRLRAEGNVRLTEPGGNVTYGDILELNDDYRDGFVDSLRIETPDATRFAAARADRCERPLFGVAERRLHRLRSLQGRPEESRRSGRSRRRASFTTKKRR